MTRPPLAEALRQVIETWRDPEFWKDDGCRMDSKDCADVLTELLRASSSVEASPQEEDLRRGQRTLMAALEAAEAELAALKAASALRGEASPQDKKPWCQICGKETPVYCADCFEALRGEASPPQEPCGDCGQPILEGQEIATVCPGDAPTYRVHKRCGKRATAHGRIAARVVSEDSK